MSQTTFRGTQKVGFGAGQLLFGVVVFGVLAGLLVAVPYLYARMTVAWAGSTGRPDTIPGTWVGEARIVKNSDHLAFATLAKSGADGVSRANAAVMLTTHQQWNFGSAKFAGELTVCDASGHRTTGKFHEGWMMSASEMTLNLDATDGFPSGFDGRWSPGKMVILWTFSAKEAALAVLHKTDAADFERACANIARTQ